MTTEYRKTVKQYIDNNHVTKIPPEDLTPEKIYVVYDAAAKYRNCSLNDHLLKGPDLLNNLVSIGICFRLGQFVVTSDIEQMFHQVHVKQEDRDAPQFCGGKALKATSMTTK